MRPSHPHIQFSPQLPFTCTTVRRHAQVSLNACLSLWLTECVHLQRVNFNCLNAGALRRLGQFYNVPEVRYGSSLNELAYAVANAFTQEVRLCCLVPQVHLCLQLGAQSIWLSDWYLRCVTLTF